MHVAFSNITPQPETTVSKPKEQRISRYQAFAEAENAKSRAMIMKAFRDQIAVVEEHKPGFMNAFFEKHLHI